MPSPLNPDLAALLAAVRAAPADDTPRLVLADWLDEHDDPDRAALLRVQCELSRPTADAERTAHLRTQERELIDGNWRQWTGELSQVLAAMRAEPSAGPGPHRPSISVHPLERGSPCRFDRGLLTLDLRPTELLDARLLDWLRTAPAAWVEVVRVSLLGGIESFEAFDIPPELDGLLGVSLTPYTNAAAGQRREQGISLTRWERFLRGRNFAALRGLALANELTAPAHLAALAAADVSRIADLKATGLTDRGLVTLLSGRWERLSALDISCNDLGPAAGAVLAGCPHLHQLTKLSAYRNRLGDAGLVALARSPLAESLTVLELQNNGIGSRGAKVLAESPLLGRLHGPALNLMMNQIGDAGAEALAECPHLARFTELILRENRVGNAGAKALAASPFAANLYYCDLWRNAVGDPGAKALAASPHLEGVRDLCLRDNAVTPKGAAALAARFGPRAKV